MKLTTKLLEFFAGPPADRSRVVVDEAYDENQRAHAELIRAIHGLRKDLTQPGAPARVVIKPAPAPRSTRG